MSTVVVLAGGLGLLGAPWASGRCALTRHTFDVRADAICATAEHAGSAVPDVTDPAGLKRASRSIAAIANTALAGLRVLKPPKELSELWQAYLLGFRQETKLAVAGLNAAAAGDKRAAERQFRRVMKLGVTETAYARQLGTRVCSA